MSEAEDVLLAAAERVATATRGLWERNAAPEEAAERRAARAERRIAAWLAAGLGAPLPVTAWDAPPAAPWLARVLGRPAPWQRRPRAVAWTDGRRLFVPRDLLGSESDPEGERLLLAALAQGLRAARGRVVAVADSPIERDVRFAFEAARGDAELADLFPGLAPSLSAARDEALAARPPLPDLLPSERGVESVVRTLLSAPLWSALADDERVLPAHARRIASRLGPLPGRYRGVAPVEHWGAPGWVAPVAGAATSGARGAPSHADRARRPQTRPLGRHVLRRPAVEEDGDSRRGPFVLPHGDPHLAVQDARGVARPEDRGEEDADALADELGRLGALPTVRSEGAVCEILEAEGRGARAGAAGSPAASDTPGLGHPLCYPEWDVRVNGYRDPGIALREGPVPGTDPAWAAHTRRELAPLLARLRRHFEALRPRRERVGRQLEGDTVDVDGIVAEHAERRAGLAPEGRVYARERPRRRDVSVALLLDASGSTDAWVARDLRVIDVAKQAALCLGEALTALGDRHAVYAFSGRGPGDVRVQVAKSWAEPWSESARGRLGAIQPDRATRLGGPIRHVTARLARQAARARLLLVLSDGKPDDEDVYEGAYGLEDVRQAVFEARRQGVHPFCVTIDRAGPSYLPHLFGPHGYTVLWDVAQLPSRLPAIYRRLAAL